jgi:hypothetical protein
MATYTVKRGDTLGQIAANLGISDWRQLFVDGTLAGETDPRKLQIGATITTTAPGTIDPDEPVTETTAETATTEPSQPTRSTSSIVDDDPGTVQGEVIEEGAEGPITRAAGILGGGTLMRVQRAGREDFYFQVYPTKSGQYVYYQYDPIDTDGDGIPDQIGETFGDQLPTVQVISEDQWTAREGKDLWNVGNAGAVIGVPGNFQQLWDTTVLQSLNAAGINDPSMQQALINDPDWQELIARSSFPGSTMSEAEFTAELRDLPVYKEQVYPGIQFFYDRGDANPEASWRQYENNVTPDLGRLGFTQDPDGTYKSAISEMLSKGVSDQEFVDFSDTMLKIQQNPDLKPVMDQWARLELGRDLDFDEFIDLLAGTTDPELNQVIEAATLQFAANQAGLPISVQDIRDIAAATDLTAQAALNAFTEADAQLLATPEELLQSYGFGKGDIIDSLVGRTPRSGLSIAQVQNLQNKVARERGISDDPTASFFLGFTERGTPARQGTLGLAGIGG